MTPEWLRDLLTELSGIAHGHTANQDSARRVLLAVPLEHIHAAGLDTAAFGGVVEAIFENAVDEDPVDRDKGILQLRDHIAHTPKYTASADHLANLAADARVVSVYGTSDPRTQPTAAAGSPKRGERGFTYFDPIESTYGGDVRVSESSAACGPHIWVRVKCPADLNDPTGPTVEAVAHLALRDAKRLRKQLKWLIKNHYQRRAGQ